MKEIYDLAEQYHNDGNNCVESVVKACNDGLELGLPDVAIRMVSGMGGGIGRSGCVCGALSGSCLVISSSVGRLDPSEKHQTEVYKYTHEFHERFTKHFGASCCSSAGESGFSSSTLPVFIKLDASMKKIMRRNAMSPIEESGKTRDGFLRLLIAIVLFLH